MNIPGLLFLAVGSFIGAFTAIAGIGIMAAFLAKPLLKRGIGRVTERLMSERYPENLWEIVTAMTRMRPQAVLENSLRAHSGKVIERPFGSPRKFLNFDGLVFSPAQLAVLPQHENVPVDMKITIGPRAKKPLTLEIPLLIGAMGYGVGISERVKIAIAKGTAAVGTATNSGEGGFLPEERAHAKYLIFQYHRAHWSKNPEILRRADAIEIHLGQGATAAAASTIPPAYLKGRARRIMQLQQRVICERSVAYEQPRSASKADVPD